MNELYEELETPECERKISRIAKAKDFTKNNQIKEEHNVLLRDLDKILGRWKGYFDKLLNGENNRFLLLLLPILCRAAFYCRIIAHWTLMECRMMV